MKARCYIGAVAVAALCLPISFAEASPILLGEDVETFYHFPDLTTNYAGPDTALVGAGVELVNFAAFADIDFSDTNILITINRDAGINAVSFDGFHFFDVDGTIPAFTTVLLNASTNYAGFTASRITFDADNIFVNVVGLPGLQGQFISIDLAANTAVPEPATLALLGGGLALLASFGRRRH